MTAPRRIGLLFVHGMGEQARFEHLTSTVGSFAEHLRLVDKTAKVSIVDRTPDWDEDRTLDPTADAPTTLSYVSDTEEVHFECHEVWWADLGFKPGLVATLGFWMWGLGQWLAPIYRDLDASGAERETSQKRESPIAILPESVAGHFWQEAWARFQLMFGGLAAFLTFSSWSIGKRLVAGAIGETPSPALIAQYLGDVRVYEARMSANNTMLPDPGFPRRVTIRRRMVQAMVAMALRKYDGWFVVSHSLGSILAYNGLTEISHTLPNYLDKPLWDQVPRAWKSNKTVRRRPMGETDMMPARPSWVAKGEIIDRAKLFAGLSGFLTYGSPLNKFAGLWPRIIASANERPPGETFPNCHWLNLAAPHDPVAGLLKPFAQSPLRDDLPELVSVATPVGYKLGLAHIHYFKAGERSKKTSVGSDQKRETMRWLLEGGRPKVTDHPTPWWQKLLLLFGYSIVVLALAVLTGSVVVAAGGLTDALFSSAGIGLISPATFFCRLCEVLPPTIGVMTSLVAIVGLLRWFRESCENRRIDSSRARTPLRRLFNWQFGCSLIMGLVPGVIVGLLALITLLGRKWVPDEVVVAPIAPFFPLIERWASLIAAGITILLAITVQALINRIFIPRVDRDRGEASGAAFRRIGASASLDIDALKPSGTADPIPSDRKPL